jgi:ABC-2 type transport system ATP-binding protein
VLDHGVIVAEGSPGQLKRRIPGGHVRLQFAGLPELESAAKALGVIARDEESLTLQVPGDGRTRSLRALLDQLDEAGVEAETLSVHTPDLDDVFFALTGHATEQAGQQETQQHTEPEVSQS